MAAPFTFDVRGLKDLQRRIDAAPAILRKEIDREIRDSADKIARNAQRDAPVDEGKIRQQINVEKTEDMLYKIVSAAEYSPYVEWGTKRRAKVPSELASYASQFRGKGRGSAQEALRSILGWVRRKGIRYESAGKFKSGQRKGRNKQLSYEQTAYVIFHYIMITGIKPHPYFFKNFDAEKPRIIKNIEAVLNRI
jgi:hypothetical protein